MGKDKITSHDRAELFDHLVSTKPRDPTSNIRVTRPKCSKEMEKHSKTASVIGLLSGKKLSAAPGGTFITEIDHADSDEDQELLERYTMKKVNIITVLVYLL